MATLAASVFEPGWLVVWGSPRVGDQSFIDTVKAANILPIVDHCDVVTRVPPPIGGYTHLREFTECARRRAEGRPNCASEIRKQRRWEVESRGRQTRRQGLPGTLPFLPVRSRPLLRSSGRSGTWRGSLHHLQAHTQTRHPRAKRPRAETSPAAQRDHRFGADRPGSGRWRCARARLQPWRSVDHSCMRQDGWSYVNPFGRPCTAHQ